MIVLHAFSGAKDFAITFIVHTNSHEDSDILDFTTPGTFQANTINVDLRVLLNKRTGTPFLDVLIRFLVEVTDGSGRNFASPESLSDVLNTKNRNTDERTIKRSMLLIYSLIAVRQY